MIAAAALLSARHCFAQGAPVEKKEQPVAPAAAGAVAGEKPPAPGEPVVAKDTPPVDAVSKDVNVKNVDAALPEDIDQPEAGQGSTVDIQPSRKNSSLYSIQLRNTPLQDIFRLMARDYNLNIIVDDTVTGTITASLGDISIEEAFTTIAEMKNLTIEKKGNVLIVKPVLTTKVFQLKHASSSQLLPQVKTFSSKAGNIYENRGTNSIVVNDYSENIKNIEEYIKAVDMESPLAKKIFRLKYISAKELMGQIAPPAAGSK